MVTGGASARLLATIPWAPDGPLPRRLAPLDESSIPSAGPTLQHAAPSKVRTLPDGAVCVQSAPDPTSGECVLLRVGADGVHEPVRVQPSGAGPGWRLIDFLSEADGGWTLLELVPGPPDQVRARRIAADGAKLWRTEANAGSPDALRQLLVDRGGSIFAVSGGPPRRVVALDADGEARDVQELADATGDCFANGTGRVGFVAFDVATHARSWVTVEVETGARSVLELDADSAWGLDLPLGMDGQGRPYGSRYGTLVRFGADGRVDWELEVKDAIVDENRVWVAQSAASGAGLVALPLSAPDRQPLRLDPKGAASWRLAGRADPDAFVLHELGASPGALVTVAADGSLLDRWDAPSDVWLQWLELQIPSGPSVTDAGEVDLATRGPDGLHLIRVTPPPP
jgi:hypothetical protein